MPAFSLLRTLESCRILKKAAGISPTVDAVEQVKLFSKSADSTAMQSQSLRTGDKEYSVPSTGARTVL